MAYVSPNFKNKKALKDALARRVRYDELVKCPPLSLGASLLHKEFPQGPPPLVEVFEPGLGTVPANGFVSLEGPHYPAPHTWYGQGKMENGRLVRVK